MALDLNCRECQAGLSQVGQMAIGFRCFDHGNIGLEISELMKMAKAPLINQIAHLETQLKQSQQAVESLKAQLAELKMMLADKEVEAILNAPDSEILAEFEKLPGGVEGNVARMRELIKRGVEKANRERAGE